MTYREYQENAKNTCAELGSLELNLSHMILGLYSEENEIQDAMRNLDMINYGEELTDGNWYIANYCTFRNIVFNSIYSTPLGNKFSLNENSSKLADLVKKFVVYGKEIDIDREYYLLRCIAYNYLNLYSLNDLVIFNCLENNINKLKIRFPNKFNKEDALNRNLEAERVELEK